MNVLLRPHIITLIAVLLSFVAWCLPEELGIRKGYFVREAITLANIFWLTVWYLTIIVFAYLGFRGGRITPYSRKLNQKTPLSDANIFYWFTAVSLFGVCAAYYTILSVIGIDGMIRAFQNSTANDLRAALYTGYSIGPASLRYCSALSGGIAMSRIAFGKAGVWDVIALGALLGASAISGRIIFMFSIWIFFCLWGARRKIADSVKVSRLILISAIVILAMWFFNYSRNANYYRNRWTDDFWMAGIGEGVAYLSAPFQVALGVGSNIEAVATGSDPASYTEWEENLTTNSAFQELLVKMGWLAFGYIAVTALIAGWISGWCYRQTHSYFLLGFPIVSYAFAELWRLDLFGTGIFQSLLVVAIAVPACYGISRVSAIREKATHVAS